MRTIMSFYRLKNLLHFELSMNRKFYIMSIFGMFLFIIISFLIFFFENKNATILGQQYFAMFFYTELFLLTIFGIGYSFVELRDKISAQTYLSLPASIGEKYTVQFVTRILIFPLLYTILFVLGVAVSKYLFGVSSTTIYGDTPSVVIGNLDILSLVVVFQTLKIPVLYYLIIGIGGLIVSLMFSGGIIFGKWNPVLMPLALSLFCLLLFFTMVLLSWIVIGIPEQAADLFIPQLEFQQPKLFGDSLLLFVMTIVVWGGIPVFFWIAYLKLKEHEL